MKKIILLFSLLLFGNLIIAQMNYQFVMLDDNDDPVQNTVLGIQFKIRAGSSSGTIVYQETNDVLTDEYGRASVAIGTGTPVIGTYDAIDRAGKHFLDVEVDIDGGSNYQPFTSSEIFPAFKADEIDPDFAASPASSITQTDIDNWNNDEGITTETDPIYSADPASSITQADIDNWNNDEGITTETDPVYSADPASSITQADIDNWNAGGSVVVVVNQANHTNVSVSQNDIVQIEGNITISSNYNKLDRNKLHVSGGEFIGSGSETIYFGDFSVISNMYFTNVKISGIYVTFNNCKFDNVTQLPSKSNIQGGYITGSSFSTGFTKTNFYSTKIQNSNIPRARSFINCVINDCTLGSTSYTINFCKNNTIDDTTIYPEVIFANNNCENTSLIVNNNVQFVNIIGNKFDEELVSGGNSFIVTINRTTTYAQNQVKIANNFFWGDQYSSKHIQINGTYNPGSFDSIIHIIGNSFTKGDQVVENNSSGTNIIFSNNIRNNVSNIGISAGGGVYLNYNIFIP